MFKLLNRYKFIYILSIFLVLSLNGCNYVNDLKPESKKQETKIEIENKKIPLVETKNDYKPLSGWQEIENNWFYFNNGSVTIGWVEDNNKWYYCTNLGLQKGWLSVDNKWYYFNENGEMLVDTITPDGYSVDFNGIRI